MFAIFPEILQQADKGDYETVALLVRKYFGEQQIYAPNLKVEGLCANAEIQIVDDYQKGAAKLEAWDAKGQFRIAIALHPNLRNARERNYILAHMLGHVFLDLHPKMAKGELQRTIFEKKSSPLRELLEGQGRKSPADDFALALLLPRGMVKKALDSLASEKDAAAFFQVDLPLFHYRMQTLGLASRASASAQNPAPTREAPARAASAREPVPQPKAKGEVQKAPGAEPKKAAGAEPKKAAGAEPKKAAGAEPNKAPQTAARKSEVEAPTNPDLSSLTRVNRSVAARSYKTENEREGALPHPQKSVGLEKLRKLARKIDKSVDE